MPLNKLHLRLANEGKVLATRRAGRLLGRQLQDRWTDSPFVILDFSEVIAVTPPFLDELFKAMRAELGGAEGGIVVATDMNEDVCETAKMVLERERSALVSLVDDDQLDLITTVPNLAETFGTAAKLKVPFTADELAKRLRLSVQNANQRLVTLRKVGAVTRQPDSEVQRGRRFLYLAASPELLTGKKPRPQAARGAGRKGKAVSA